MSNRKIIGIIVPNPLSQLWAPITSKDSDVHLWNANPNCKHVIIELWSGIKCKNCPGWFCY